MTRSTGILAIAAGCVLLAGCGATSTSSESSAPYPLTLQQTSDANADFVYDMARVDSPDWLNVYAFESSEEMFGFISAANEDSAVTAITGFARNPGYYVVEIHVGETTVRDAQRRARGALDKLSAEFGGINAVDGPRRVVGQDGITPMWLARPDSVYGGDDADYYNSLIYVTMAFSFDTEEDANFAADYFADAYETQVSAADDGLYSLLATRPIKRGDAVDEASGVEPWIAWFHGRFEWVSE